MPKQKIIEVNWTYPKSFDSAWDSDQSYGQGVYQITRRFGTNETLLYIGLVKSKSRNLYERLEEHEWWIQDIRGKIYIRFGKVVGRQGFTLTESILETLEGALIFQHKPDLNTAKINSYTIHHHLYITNFGYRGHLNKEIDTLHHI